MFYPYIKPLGVGGLDFFFANEEAQAWYDPLKPYTKLEYEWVFVRPYQIGEKWPTHATLIVRKELE